MLRVTVSGWGGLGAKEEGIICGRSEVWGSAELNSSPGIWTHSGTLALVCKPLSLSDFICKVGRFGPDGLLQGLADLFCKRPESKYVGIMGHTVSVAMTSHCHCSEKAATENTFMSEREKSDGG